MLSLRPYQEKAFAAIDNAFTVDGLTRLMVAHATGTGKTVLFSHVIRARGGRALVLVHRDELLRQAVAKLSDIGIKDVGVVKAEEHEPDAPVVVASVQTLASSPKRLDAILAAGKLTTLVIDEAHHALAPTYRAIMERCGSFTDKSLLTLGVTATPFRGNQSEGLGDVFEKIAHHYSIAQGIADKFLCPVKALSIRLQADFSKLKTAHGDITASSAGKVLLDADAPSTIAAAVEQYAKDRPTLIFAPTVESAREIARACRARGLKFKSIFGTTLEHKRRSRLKAFSKGKLDGLVNCGVLTEGYDEARVACIVMARPTKSQVLYVQIIGRGTRPHPDKADLLVLDVVGAVHRHDLVSTATVLPKSAVVSSPVVVPSSGLKDKFGFVPTWLQPGFKPGFGNGATLKAEAVDIFATQPFAWIKTSFGYVLDCGRDFGWIVLRQSSNGWKVETLHEAVLTPIWSGSSFSYAQAQAEAIVGASGAAPLAKRDAPWRSTPMTGGQCKMLEAWRIPYTVHWSKGQASNAITRALAEAHYRRA